MYWHSRVSILFVLIWAPEYDNIFVMRRIFLTTLSFLAIFGFASQVFALDFTPPTFKDTSYLGKYVGQSVADPVIIPLGSYKDVTIKIKNVGKSVWYNTGSNYVSAYTVNPNYHASQFSGSGWISKSQPAKILKTIKPGETAEIKIKLYGNKAGDFKENFYLAAENKSWIQSSYFYLKIKVTPSRTSDLGLRTSASEDADATGNSTGGEQDQAEEINKDYGANLLAFSAREVYAVGGERVAFKVRYLNIGEKAWNNYLWQETGSSVSSSLEIASVSKVKTADETWLSQTKIIQEERKTASGDVLEITYNFRAPPKKGVYTARFQLMANAHTLDGGTLELPVTVTADAPSGYTEPVFASNRQLIQEPNIRVGLYKATGPVQFQSQFLYDVYSGEIKYGTLPFNELATISYFDGLYTFKSNSINFNARDPVKFIPPDFSNYFTLVNYDRHVSWKGAKNFNMYRGVMEFKYSPKSDAPFVINELPLDLYIAGIGETSNGAAMEYIKAILAAARTYAYYHLNNGVPADQRTFDVVATTADQLYLGYNSEVLMPRVVQAQQATYGEMVTYNTAPVVTPYFGHSDGRTRTWSQVWGGTDKPWLQSVEAKYDVGLRMFGHGVGMSARDAAQRADKDAWTYDQLLKLYYTGVEVEKIY